MTFDQLVEKFENRGVIKDAFQEASKVLIEAVSILSKKQLALIFGNNIYCVWYSVEIVYSKNPNVINYDGNNLIFHSWPSFKQDLKTNNVEQYINEEGVEVLSSNIQKMQKAIKELNWTVYAPIVAQLNKISDNSFMDNVLASIDDLMSEYDLDDKDTIDDYMHAVIGELAVQSNVPQGALDLVVSKVLGDSSAVNVNVFKKNFADEFDVIKKFLDSSKDLIYKAVEPLEKIVQKLAVKLLSGMYSVLVLNPKRETVRLKDEVKNAIKKLKSSNDPKLLMSLQKQLVKLEDSFEDIVPIEGIVFTYKGRAFKFTGNFAPLNQILGMLRYNRANLDVS
jgi:hypothetical protein